MTPERTAVRIVLVKAFPAMSINTRDRSCDWHHDSRAGNREALCLACQPSHVRPTRAAAAANAKRDFGNTHGVAPIHHGARRVLLEMSTTRSVSSSAPNCWSARMCSTTPSKTSCSLSLMVWRARVSLATRLKK